mmetsp:Transcript_6014/g.18126  ORF Transcript_6014/g.18126 Transcript_6014/m.18126 type:complete len:201 (+) Transcript_6014:511-1113(+)
MKSNVGNIERDTTHVLIAKDSLLGGPLEGSNTRVLDFVEILHGLRPVHQEVGTGRIRTEAPDLLCAVFVHAKFITQKLLTCLWLVTWTNLAILDRIGQVVREWFCVDVEPVVLVWRLRQANTPILRIFNAAYGLSVRHNGRRHPDFRSIHEVLPQVLEADFKMKLTGSCDDVLSGFLNDGLHQRIRLGETLEPFHKFRNI